MFQSCFNKTTEVKSFFTVTKISEPRAPVKQDLDTSPYEKFTFDENVTTKFVKILNDLTN